jgi:hypothetical protein
MKWKLTAAFLFVAALAAAQQCQIIPASPVGVIAGACVQFQQANCGPSPAWTLPEGSEGTIDQTGKYCAPNHVFVQNYSRGAQIMPNNFGANVPVRDFPALANGQNWLARIANAGGQGSQHSLKYSAGPRFFQGLFNQHSDETTPRQTMHAVYPFGLFQDIVMPLVQPPYSEMQSGWSMDVYGAASRGTGPDRHNLDVETLASGLAITNERYQVMMDSHDEVFTLGSPTKVTLHTNSIRVLQNPLRMQVTGVTGSCASVNSDGTVGKSFLATVVSQTPGSTGYAWDVTLTFPYNSSGCGSGFAAAQVSTSSSRCSECNAGSMISWPNWDNAWHGGTDAAGTSLIATSLDPQQCYHNVMDHIVDPATGHVDCVNHLVRTTFVNNLLSPRNSGIATSGNNVTFSHPLMQVTGISAANPAVVTVNYNLGVSGLNACEAPTPFLSISTTCPNFHIVFTGMTGNCAALNDNLAHSNSYYATATVVGATSQFTIPVNGASLQGCSFAAAKALFDWAPYGSVFRLKASFNVEASCDASLPWCKFYKAILYSFMDYGLAPMDGTYGFNDDWNSGILTNGFEPDDLVNAFYQLKNWYPIEPNLEVVDTSSLLLSQSSGASGVRRTQVCANTTCVDVNIVGTVVGIDANGSERMPTIYPGWKFTPTVLVTGNVDKRFTCAFETPVPGATIAPDCTVHAPTALTQVVAYKIKATSLADPTASGYASGYFVPADADGNWRLHLGGENLSYTDTQGKVWWAQDVRRQNAGAGQVFESPGGCLYCPLYGSQITNPNPGWGNNLDGKNLYGYSPSLRNDGAVWLSMPNGDYDLTVYGEAGLGVTAPGGSVYDVEINGQVVRSWVDSYTEAGGQFKAYQKVYPVTVTNGVLSFIARDRQDTLNAVYGMSPWSALLVTPKGQGPPPPSLTVSASPAVVTIVQGQQGTTTVTTAIGGSFNSQVGLGLGGTPTNTTTAFSPATIPAPGAGSSSLVISTGRDTPTGTYPLTVMASGQGLQAQTTVTLTVTPATVQRVTIPKQALKDATVGQLYSQLITVTGGVGPYKCSAVGVLPAGLKLDGCTLIGKPTMAGNRQFSLKACDSEATPQCSAVQTLSLMIQASAALKITTTWVPYATKGAPYCPFALATSGATGKVTWSTISGTVPLGMVFADGVLSGMPTEARAASVTFQAQDESGATAKVTVTVTSLAPPAGSSTN